MAKGGGAQPTWKLQEVFAATEVPAKLGRGLWGLVMPLGRHGGRRDELVVMGNWEIWVHILADYPLCLSFPSCDDCIQCPKGCIRHG